MRVKVRVRVREGKGWSRGKKVRVKVQVRGRRELARSLPFVTHHFFGKVGVGVGVRKIRELAVPCLLSPITHHPSLPFTM